MQVVGVALEPTGKVGGMGLHDVNVSFNLLLSSHRHGNFMIICHR